MKSIIIGLGVQGQKRKSVLGDCLVATVDKYNSDADADHLADVDPVTFDVIFSCVPDESKIETINDALRLKKHLLVEKPLILKNLSDFEILEKNLNNASIFLQTAYNHRFEPNLVLAKYMLDKELLGEIYSFRCFYGNGTSGLIGNSEWRNSSHGAGVDLGSHVLDLMHFMFGTQPYQLSSRTWSHETKCPDRAILFGRYGHISVSIETTYLSWQNTFQMEIIGKQGSIFVDGLCKWSQSVLERRVRVLPAGVPTVVREIEPRGDPTWGLEVSNFFSSIESQKQTDLARDRLIQEMLENSGLLNEVAFS